MDGIQNPNFQTNNTPPPSEPKFGPPPQPQINLRTAESDMRSIQRGDALPIPESVLPPENPNEPVFRPETQVPGMVTQEEASSGGKKKVLLWVIIGVAILVVGGVGYFVVYPLLFPGEPKVSPAEAPPPPPAAVIPHHTLFVGSAGATTEAILPDLLQTTIVANLANVAAFKQPDSTVQEVVLKDGSGNQISFKNFLNAFIPTLTVDALGKWFEDDFTAFMYYDGNGTWPGFVARLKTGININEARTALAALEGGDVSKFYLLPAGSFDPFKDGKLKDYATRYAKGSIPGVSLNYGFAGNYFLVSTSYNGLKSAAGLLGI